MGEGDSDLAQGLGSGAGADALVTGQDDLLGLAIGTDELGLDGDDLVVEQAGVLGPLGALEALGGVFVHLFSCDAEVAAHVLAGPAHGLHAVDGFLVLGRDGFVKGAFEGIAADGHGLCADGNANVDVAERDGVGNVGSSLEAGGAETVEGVGAGRVGEAGGEGGGTEPVGSLAVRDLFGGGEPS